MWGEKKSMLLLFLKFLHFKRILASYIQRSLNGGMRSSKEDGSEYFVFFFFCFFLLFSCHLKQCNWEDKFLLFSW